MSKIYTLARRALLGWLAAEWLGVLIAYAFAALCFGFLIAYFVVVLEPQLIVLVPVAILLSGVAVALTWVALGVPRGLYALAAAARATADRYSAPIGPVADDRVPSVPSWSADRMLSRVGTLMSLDRAGTGTRSGAVASGVGLDEWVPRDRPSLGRSSIRGWDPMPKDLERIPLETVFPLTPREPIRIVDLSDPSAPQSVPHRI
ncbi:MAG TPA: hypothetical protein VGV89_05755 [Thermoplasmata archaeon]|nr:hypothetical protein [Thermoplasmata archaeon]